VRAAARHRRRGRRRIAPEGFEPSGYWQLSLTGVSRLSGTAVSG
jgi:hypothetical protein